MVHSSGVPIEELAQSLSRARSGGGTNAEVIAWLRAASELAASIAPPQMKDAPRTYSRTLLHRCDRFEILVLHWAPGSVTSIHDHGGAHCWFAVARGNVGVENFVRRDRGATPGHARIDFTGRQILGTSAIDYREDDIHLHRCFAGDEEAVSLHVYARPIDRFYTFDERAQTCAEASATYDAILTV